MRKICILLTIGMLLGMLPAYADDSASAAVVDSYVWQFAPQGTNGWYNVVYQGGEWVNMEIGSRGTYVAAGGYPTIESNCLNTGDKDVAFKFVAPTKGMVRLRGEVKGARLQLCTRRRYCCVNFKGATGIVVKQGYMDSPCRL